MPWCTIRCALLSRGCLPGYNEVRKASCWTCSNATTPASRKKGIKRIDRRCFGRFTKDLIGK